MGSHHHRWVLPTLLLCTGCLSAPGHSGPPTEHFDGERFRNQAPFAEKSIRDLLAWRWERDPQDWSAVEDFEYGPAPRPREEDLKVTFIGHATVLVQVAGMNVLTDPQYSERSGPFTWAGSRRVHPPGIRFEDLPPIDAVVVSHNHYDHLDLVTLERLAKRDQPTIVAGLGTRALLEEHGIAGGKDLDWWQSTAVGESLRIHFVPAQHWSKRGAADDYNTLWGGFVLETPRGHVYYAGDTGWGPQFRQVRQRFGRVRAALLPIGAYLPRWFMRDQHIDPGEAVRAHKVLEADVSVAVHFDTFQLADEAQGQAPKDLRQAMVKAAARHPFWVLKPGQGRAVPTPEPPVAAGAAVRP